MAFHAARKRSGECAIDFNASEMLHMMAKKIRSYTRTGANLEEIRA
jgi:hypothetical protein